MKIFLITLGLLILTSATQSQTIIDRLHAWVEDHPIEKVYLHTDRSQYHAGETVWLKAYFISGFFPSVDNSTLYVELLNEQQEIICREVLPVYAAVAIGQVELPDSLSSGTYQIRAYSVLMLNQPDFVFRKQLMVVGKENKKQVSEKTADVRMEFFPEGGNFVSGVTNRIAFKISNGQGYPADGSGEVRNNKNEVISSFKSEHDGMGIFSMVPEEGQKYHAVLKGMDKKYPLPEQVDAGVVLQVTGRPDRKEFKIISSGNDDALKPAYLVGQIQNRVIFSQILQSDKKEVIGFIKTEGLYSGIIQFTVFNKNDIPLAQRIAFIDNHEYILPAVINADTVNTKARMRNRFTIAVPDSIAGNFSVSVTDADYETDEIRNANIYSALLLTGDLRGYVHKPAYYFNIDGEDRSDKLDLVMMTNGWTRFRWEDLASGKPVKPSFKDQGYIKLSGRVFIEGTKKPLASKELVLFISASDSPTVARGLTRLVQTDESGFFEVDSLFFYDKMNVWFSEVRGKKNKFLSVIPAADSLWQNYNLPVRTAPGSGSDTLHVPDLLETDYLRFMKEKGIVLKDVIIKARQKTEIDKLDEEYSSGFFSGNVFSRRLDLRHAGYGGNIFDYLKERIPGLQITGDPGNYVLNYRGGNLRYYTDGAQVDGGDAQPATNNGNVSLFLNEMQTNVTALESLSLNDLALVKLFPYSVMSAGGGPALVIYTKKDKDVRTVSYLPTTMIIYEGYSVVKEFYHPDYELPLQTLADDQRITLYWNPDITVSGSHQKIPVIFFNNDRTRRFKIVAEGLTTDGQMLMAEKIIEGRW